MRKMNQIVFLILLAVGANQISNASASSSVFESAQVDTAEIESARPSCSLANVKKWTAVGSRWTLGSDASGHSLALYDLSYSILREPRRLGRMGGAAPNPAELAQALADSRESVAETAAEKAETNRAIARLKRLAAANDSNSTEETSTANWIGQIPWKPVEKSRMAPLVQRFTLDDIDVEATVKNTKKYRAQVAAIDSEFVEAGEGSLKVRDLYRQLSFQRQADGSYEMTFEGKENPAGLRKIAGIACVRDVRNSARVWNAFRNLFSVIFAQITNGAVQGVFATALNRYAHYQQLRLASHIAMVTEALVTADQGQGGPLANLSNSDREQLKLSVMLSQDSAGAILKRIFRAPKYEWKRFIEREQAQTSDAVAWLQGSGFDYLYLNPRFALQTRPQTNERVALLSLSRKVPFKKGPYVSYRYDAPSAIRARRIWNEAEIIAVDFASRMIPLWGIVVRKANERLIQTPMNTQKVWEARLTHVLEERERTEVDSSQAWEREIQTLDDQRINPLESQRKAMLTNVAAIKARLGI